MATSAGGDLTDVPGIRVGHWTDDGARTGCTVVLLPDDGAVCSVDVRGAGPGTRETDVVGTGSRVPVAHAVLLTGGSAFGLAAATGVVRRLAERGLGLPTPVARVPIVPAAVVYDLAVGSPDVRPGEAEGYAAATSAEDGSPCGSGRVGAGTGATVGKLFGPDGMRDGGLGTASRRTPQGHRVGALAVVNAVGDVLAEDGSVLAGPGTVRRLLTEPPPSPPPTGTNTTLAVVATDAPLTKTQAHRLAVLGHDALARAIAPVHTGFDGDTVFVVSTARTGPEDSAAGTPADDRDFLTLQVSAGDVLERAIRAAVR